MITSEPVRNGRSVAGRFIFCTAMAGMGIEPLFTGHLPAALIPVSSPLPPWVAGGIGILLIVVALAAAVKPTSVAPYLLAGIPLLALLGVNGPKLVAAPRDPGPWTTVFELIALSSGAVLLVKPKIGRLMLAAALAVFGTQHLMYGAFVATLVPKWIPARLFWAYAIGVAFFAAALSFLLNKMTRLSGTLLGIMFLTWVVILHLPRVMAAHGKDLEWNSLLVALAMGGIGLIVAGSSE